MDPNTGKQREYTPQNIQSGLIKGGHDTLTAEGVLLKEKVHQQTDPDGGKSFKDWSDLQALPFFRTGAHDEDSTIPLLQPLIGPGERGGNQLRHFYDPATGKGLFYTKSSSAVTQANNYITWINELLGCDPAAALSGLSQSEKEKLYDAFGRIMHLIQDMGNPAHTNNDVHVFTATFEDYVNDHWADIVNSDSFKNSVTVDDYLAGNYEMTGASNPEEYIKALANISKNFYTDGLGTITTEQLNENVKVLIPETIKYVAGYIDSIYKLIGGGGSAGANARQLIMLAALESDVYKLAQLIGQTGGGGADVCALPPPEPSTPGGGHPDDRFDVSDEFYWEKEFKLTDYDLTNLYMRTAIKKGKIGVWYKKRFMEIFAEGRTRYAGAPQSVKDAIEAEFQSFAGKLKERRNLAESDWKGAPDIALLTNGYYKPSISLMLKMGEPVSFEEVNLNPEIVKDHPVLLVPTGGFYGQERSSFLKDALDEYVKRGGTLIVFAQQRGYEFSVLPTPDGRQVTGYGWEEDQNCFTDAVYIETWHQFLSGQKRGTPTLNVDGYFTSYPSNSTVLLRRTANGQPAMLMYEHGLGRVVVTTMYTDWAYGHSQASREEIALVRDLISWAKKPAILPEARPGDAISLPLSLINSSSSDAAQVKLTVLDPDRNIISEQTIGAGLPVGGSGTIPFSYTTAATSPLGIYHVDYTLLDSAGNIIQPQAETDSGRFAVSSPPTEVTQTKPLTMSITAPTEHYFAGQEGTFTWHVWNNSVTERTVTVRYGFPHHAMKDGTYGSFPNFTKTLTIAPQSEATFTHAITVATEDSVHSWLYDESNILLKDAYFKIWLLEPSTAVNIRTDKSAYARGEAVNLTVDLQNKLNAGYAATLNIKVTDPSNALVYSETRSVTLASAGALSQGAAFTLTQTSKPGFYAIYAEVFDSNGKKIGGDTSSFEVPGYMLTIAPVLPSVFGISNNISLRVENRGFLAVASALLSASLTGPEGAVVWSGQMQGQTLQPGQSVAYDFPVSIQNLMFGDYRLSYTLSYEGGMLSGEKIIPNTASIALALDKTSYRMREQANLTLTLTNTGRFNLDNVSVTVNMPDAGYTDTSAVSLPGAGSLISQASFVIPANILSGQHDVNVILTLQSGNSMVQAVKLTVPGPELSIGYAGPAALNAGDTISLTAENAGGVDTVYATEKLVITDKNGIVIYDGNVILNQQ